jgi:hypothetical protein
MLVLWQMRSCLLRGRKLDRMQVAAMPGGPEAVLSGARARLRISRGPLGKPLSWVGKSSTFRKPLPSLYTDQPV